MTTHARTAPPGTDRGLLLLRLGLGALGWAGLYALNEWFWDAAVGWLGLDLGERLVASVHFFLYDTVKIFLLLLGLMFVVGLLRASLDLDRARAYLEGRGLGLGLFLAVVLGVVTPFCSCSSIPLFQLLKLDLLEVLPEPFYLTRIQTNTCNYCALYR